MPAFLHLLAAGALLLLAACSSGKTRLDCFDECKRKGLTYSGVVSSNMRVDDTGQVETTEVCRCNIEDSIL